MSERVWRLCDCGGYDEMRCVYGVGSWGGHVGCYAGWELDAVLLCCSCCARMRVVVCSVGGDGEGQG